MQTEYLVIGAGIAGTLISYELMQRNKSVVVIDNVAAVKASAVAGAILNPVNIKQWSLAKDYQRYIAEALDSYTSFQYLLNTPVISEVPVIVFDAPVKRANILMQPFLHNITAAEDSLIDGAFINPFSAIKIAPSFQVHAGSLLTAWQKYLFAKNAFLDDYFDIAKLNISDNAVIYKHIHAKKIIFCEGAAAIQNPLFRDLPFTKNRGDVLLIAVQGMPEKFIYHNGIRLIPVGGQLFWCGSNYTWNYTDLNPDAAWKKQTIAHLRQWLKLPFTIQDHIVAERPTTAGQQPLMLAHESLPAFMFNGLGTKGFLMAPLLAKQFVDKITDDFS